MNKEYTILIFLNTILIIIIILGFLLNNYKDKFREIFKSNKNHYDYIKGYNDLLNEQDHIKYTPGGISKIIIKTSWQKKSNLPK